MTQLLLSRIVAEVKQYLRNTLFWSGNIYGRPCLGPFGTPLDGGVEVKRLADAV